VATLDRCVSRVSERVSRPPQREASSEDLAGDLDDEASPALFGHAVAELAEHRHRATAPASVQCDDDGVSALLEPRDEEAAVAADAGEELEAEVGEVEEA
jgi:hypothetical protein